MMNAWKDSGKICLLLLLYTLQGIPMGLSASVPFILQKKISYKQQSLISLASLPFSFKLLWAPIVDGYYFKSIGRRRSWLIPLQIFAGLLMILVSYPTDRISVWLGESPENGSSPNVVALASFFGLLYFLMATQDIAVDGWALTMLSPENIGHASTCNAIGQTFGYCIAYVGFLALNDPGVCNRLFRDSLSASDQGIVSLAGFMWFWGFIFIGTTICVILFYKETDISDNHGHSFTLLHDSAEGKAIEMVTTTPGRMLDEVADLKRHRKHSISDKDVTSREEPESTEENHCIIESYKLLGRLLLVKPVTQLVLCLLTYRAAFGPVDSSTQLKIIERGVSKEELAFFAPLLLPLGLVSPVFVGKWVNGEMPLKPFTAGYFLRLFMGLIWMGMVALTPILYGGSHSSAFYFCLFIVTCASYVCSDLMFVSQMAFFARISDPKIGGTYMTFLNTASNLGSQWPNALSLCLMDYFTIRDCSETDTSLPDYTCPVWLDGYFVQVALGIALGFVWLRVAKPVLEELQQLDPSCWRLNQTANSPNVAKALESISPCRKSSSNCIQVNSGLGRKSE